MISTAPLPTKIESGSRSEHPAELGRDHAVLRRVQLQQRAELPRPDDLAVQVHQEQVGGVRVGQEAGVDLQPELGDLLGERPGAGRMRARLLLEPLDPLDQGLLAGVEVGPPGDRAAAADGARGPRGPAESERLEFRTGFAGARDDHFSLVRGLDGDPTLLAAGAPFESDAGRCRPMVHRIHNTFFIQPLHMVGRTSPPGKDLPPPSQAVCDQLPR